MKRLSIIMMAVALVLGMAQCKKTIKQITPGGEGVYVTVTASHDDGAKTDILPDGIVKWSAGDKLYVVGATQGYLGELTIVNYTTPSNWAEFAGNIAAISDIQNIHFYYFGKQGLTAAQITALEADPTNYDYSIATQDGTLDGIENTMHLAHGSKTGVAAGTTKFGNVTMHNMMAIAKFDISGYSSTAVCNAVASASLNLKTGELTPSAPADITLTNPTGNYYMALIPKADQTISFGSPVDYTATRTIEAGKFYTDHGLPILVHYTPWSATVVTIPVCAVHATCASSGGVVTGTGVHEQGVCWGTGANPTIAGSHYVHNYEYATGSLTPKNTTTNNTFTGFMSGLTQGATYHVRAYIRKGGQVKYGDDLTFPTLASEPTIGYVDLGLPSGTIWATCNLGAANEYDYGDYYMWGDNAACTGTTSDKTVSCIKQSYRFAANTTTKLTKYCPGDKTSYWYNYSADTNEPDNKLQLELTDDCVRQTLGGDWRMPTAADWQELADNTTCKWRAANASITIGGNPVSMPVAGRYFVSNMEGYTAKYIFLPAAGRRITTGFEHGGSIGYYWSRSLGSSDPTSVFNMYLRSSYIIPQGSNERCNGLSIRPVR